MVYFSEFSRLIIFLLKIISFFRDLKKTRKEKTREARYFANVQVTAEVGNALEKFKEIMDIFYKEIDRAFVWWQSISWTLLLGGYLMLVSSYSAEDPSFLIEFGGLISVLISIFNFFASLLIGALYITKGITSRDKSILTKRASYIVAYLVVAIIIMIVSINAGYLF